MGLGDGQTALVSNSLRVKYELFEVVGHINYLTLGVLRAHGKCDSSY